MLSRHIVFTTISCFASVSAQSAEQHPKFEVASIRRVDSEARVIRNTILQGRLTAENVTLRMLIENAFDLRSFQLTGGPRWLDSDRFTVMAQTDASATNAQIRVMVQSLLIERFHLAMHSETKEQSLYVLQVKDKDKAKLKFQPSEDGGSQGLNITIQGMADPALTYKFRKYTMARLADVLSRETQRYVRDETGLSGEFDFEVKAIREPDEKNPFAASLAPLVSDLGLKLDGQKGPVEFFIIDRVEPPSEN